MAIVTISRKSGTGAKEIAKAAAERLRYEFVSKDSIYKEIEEHGKEWLGWVARLDEHPPTLRERYDQSHAAYLALVEHCIYRNALKNNVVILGRGATISLRPSLTPCGSASPRPWRIGKGSSSTGSESMKRRRGKFWRAATMKDPST